MHGLALVHGLASVQWLYADRVGCGMTNLSKH